MSIAHAVIFACSPSGVISTLCSAIVDSFIFPIRNHIHIKKVKMQRNPIAQYIVSVPDTVTKPTTTVAMMSQGNSTLTIRPVTGSLQIKAPIPSTSPILAMFDPKMFPKHKSPCPFEEAIRFNASSGELVLNATIVSPMTSVLIPSCFAIATLPSTRR